MKRVQDVEVSDTTKDSSVFTELVPKNFMHEMKFKRLAIVSDCIHFFDNEGKVVTENHIFRKQMEMLASYFAETVVCCPFADYSSGKVTSRYTTTSMQFIPLPNVGGNTFSDKLKLIKTIPAWIKTFSKMNQWADVVYQRFPNNLNIAGALYFYLSKAKVFATYTGTWNDYKREPFSYRLQKWFLKKHYRGPVWAYLNQSNFSDRIFKTFSPSYSCNEWLTESELVDKKLRRLETSDSFVPVFVTVGALIKYKNQQYILEAFKRLNINGFDFKLYVAGDGPLKEEYEQFIKKHKLEDKIFLTGKRTETEMKALYREADFIVQAPLIEGFGKVPIEGFFHGVVPILNNISMANEITGNGERGFVFSADDVNNLVSVVCNACADKRKLATQVRNGRCYAQSQTLEKWSLEILRKLNEYYQ